MIDSTILISNALEKAFSTFKSNELALLALTSNIEHVVRDRLTYELFQQHPEQLVVREWNHPDIPKRRTDLVMMDIQGRNRITVELTAIYTFDALIDGKIAACQKKVQTDMGKLREVVKRCGGDGFFILLCTNIIPKPEFQHWSIVPYGSHIRRVIKSHGETVSAKAHDEISAWVDFKNARKGPCIEGNVFGCGVEVAYWIGSI